MNFEFSGSVIFWRGPSPFYFVAFPPQEAADLKHIANEVTYGWGVIPVRVRIGRTEWKTSLFPKDGTYLVPIKAVIRKAENIDEGDEVDIYLEIDK